MAGGIAIAKAILGAIGGGFNGAKDGMGTAQVGSANTDHASKMGNIGYTAGNMGQDSMAEQKDVLGQLFNKKEKSGDTFGNTKAKDDMTKQNNSNSYVSKGGSASKYANSTKSMSGKSLNMKINDGIVKEKGQKQMLKRADGSVILLHPNANIYATKKEITVSSEPKKDGKKCLSDFNMKEIYGENLDDSIIENFSKISAIDFSYTPEAQKEFCGECGVDNKEHIGIIAQELESNPATKGTVETDENGNKLVDTEHLTFADTAAIAELSRRVLALEEEIKRMNGGNC